jgi:hypothetical protein
MLLISIFNQTIDLELALAELEECSIPKECILVAFMNSHPKNITLQTFSSKAFEIGICIAKGCAVLGASFGFILKWGPIIWGLIAALIGFTIGFGFYFLFKWHSFYLKKTNKKGDVTVIIQCHVEQQSAIQEILWKYQALSIGYVENQ